MCGRYTISTPLDNLVDAFEVEPPDFEFQPRYNVAPTQMAPVVAQDSRGRRMGLLRWGLVPSWADDPSLGSRLINARSETVEEKPAFRSAFRKRRCLVLADGFYEWKKAGEGKTPYWIHAPEKEPMAFAGLWERWEPREGAPLFSFTILTRDAAPEIAGIHPRMPVVLPKEERDTWLAPEAGTEALQDLLSRHRPPALTAHPVSTRVNVPGNDDPSLIEKVS